MSPNNETISKLNEDKNEEIIDCLKKLIIGENKCISYTYVSLRFGVHVKQAIETLDKFVAEERNNDHTFALNYLLSGNNDSTDNSHEIKMERFMIVNESDINTSVDWFKNGFNKHIYSVGLGEDNHKIDLNFDDFDYEVNDKKDLINLQNLTYVKNSNIEFRNVKRRTPIKPIVTKDEDNCQQKNTLNEKKKSENKPKTKTNSKAKNAKKNKVSNMFSKIKTEAKVENEDKESDDPFKSDSEDESKPNGTQESVNDKEIEEIVITEKNEKNEKIIKNGKKHSIDLISSEDEEIVTTKKRGKKYKRVRLISESDSDNETKEESPFDKYVTKKDESKPLKKMEERQETHVDEDGYVVTKIVKKEVEDNDSKLDNNQQKDESNQKAEQKPKQSLKKTSEKKPSKPLKDTKSKTQSSITSFFKPKQIST